MGKRNILAMAMEEIENEEAVAAVVPEETAMDAESTELVTDVIEETEAAASDSADIEEATDDVGDLETIADAVDEAAEGDGLSPEAAKVVEVAVESIYRRLGLKSRGALASETFAAAKTRKMATEAMGENIKSNLKKAWEAIVRFFEKAVAAVKEFFAKLFDANLRLKSASEAMIKKADENKGKKAEEKEIKAGGFVGSLTMGGNFSPKQVYESLGDLIKFADEVITDVDAFGQSLPDEAQITAMIKDPSTAADKELNLGFLSSMSVGSREDGAITLVSNELPGNRALKATVPADWKQSAKIALLPFSKSRIHVGTFNEKGAEFKGEKVAVATPEEVKAIAGSVFEMCKILEKRKASVDSLQKNLAAMVANVKKLAGKDNAGKGAKEMQAFMSKAGNVVSGLPTAMAGACVKSGKAALEYSAKSLSAIGGEKKVEKK